MRRSRSTQTLGRGRWEQERERSRIEDSYPPSPFQDPQALGAVIPGVLKKLGLGGMHWLQVLEEEWPDIVGADVARHTRPGRVVGRDLIVFVDNSVWLSELTRYGKDRMRATLLERFGPKRVRNIRLQLDPEER